MELSSHNGIGVVYGFIRQPYNRGKFNTPRSDTSNSGISILNWGNENHSKI